MYTIIKVFYKILKDVIKIDQIYKINETLLFQCAF